MIFTVLCVEFTLNFNHVAGVLARQGNAVPGQLLPLLVGLFSLVRLLWIIYREKVVERGASPNSGSPDMQNASTTRSSRPATVGSIFYGLTTAWLPWLNCFEAWIKFGGLDAHPMERFHILKQHENDGDTYDALKLRSLHLENQQRAERYE